MTRLEFRTFKRLDKITYKLNAFGVFIMLMRLFKRDKDLFFKYNDWMRYCRKMRKRKKILKEYLPSTALITPMVITSTLTSHQTRSKLIAASKTNGLLVEYSKYKKRVEQED